MSGDVFYPLRTPKLDRSLSLFVLSTILISTICGSVTSNTLFADNTVVSKINHFVEQQWKDNKITPSQTCTDQEYVRRVYLDLVGRIPTPKEAATFLADGRKNKRELLVDALLKSEDYVQHFSDIFDTLLMGREDEEKYRQRHSSGWRGYLEDALRKNRPWNVVAKEILLARPNSEEKRGSVWFLYERNNQYQEIAEAVAPAIFGIRIECAQCHDHMMVSEIHQKHYWGLVAFFNRSKNVNSNKRINVTESAIGGFSEFADLAGDSLPNLLTFVDAKTIQEERPKAGKKQEDKKQLYTNAVLSGDPKVPHFSRREKFVNEIVEDHPLVPRAMVNRLWAAIMGRGIVHPFDEMDSEHPPSHPELLDFLAEDFKTNNYNIKRTIRSIVLSKAYQLSSIQAQGVDDPASFAWYLERPLTAEQLARSIQLAVRGEFQNNDSLVGSFRQQFKEVLPDETVVNLSDVLYLSNNPTFDSYINDIEQKNHITNQIVALPSATDKIDLLFQTILTRSADPSEADAITAYLNKRDKKPKLAINQVIWSLLTSAEFRFNH